MSQETAVDPSDMLMPLQKVPDPQTGTILIVGAEGTPKKQFAECLVNTNVPYLIQVRMANYLPLPRDTANQRPNINFIVFIMEMNNPRSITTVQDSLKFLDANFFLGRICFLVTQAKDDSIHCTNITEVARLCDSYNSPMLSGNFNDEEERSILSGQVIQMMEIAAGFRADVSPLLVQATGQSYKYIADDEGEEFGLTGDLDG